MSSEVDVIVLGSGNAGFAAIGAAHNAGKSAVMVESRDIGGTCPLRGCVPKKVLVAAAECLHQIALAPEHRISVGPATLDWKKLIARKQTFVDGVPDDFRKSLENRGIQVAEGPAKFTGPHEVAVNGQTFVGKKTVIATGSKPRPLPIPGFEHAITSDDILDLQEQPKSIVFIGAGVIGMEFTHVFARAGTKVTIIEVADRPLPALEGEGVSLSTRLSLSPKIPLRSLGEVRACASRALFGTNGVAVFERSMLWSFLCCRECTTSRRVCLVGRG